MKLARWTTLALVAAAAVASSSRAAVLYSDSFSGAAANINGVPVEAGALAPAAWRANATYMADGSLDEGVEGSAILPFDPVVNAVYTLSVDVFNTTDRWVALGFARDTLTTPGVDQVQDRLSNEAEGIAWMLFRDHATDPLQDIQLFGGLRTGGGIADNNVAVTHNQVNQLKIVIDTTGTGANFTAEYFLNGASISSGPQLVNIAVADINFVGLSFDDATTVAQVTVDNFLLTGPVAEPTTAVGGLLAAAALAARRRRSE